MNKTYQLQPNEEVYVLTESELERIKELMFEAGRNHEINKYESENFDEWTPRVDAIEIEQYANQMNVMQARMRRYEAYRSEEEYMNSFETTDEFGQPLK